MTLTNKFALTHQLIVLSSLEEVIMEASENKRNDLLKLVAMRDVIEKFEISASISKLRDTLIQIGDLAGGEERISFNDDDKDSFYIRNKGTKKIASTTVEFILRNFII